MTAIFPVLRVLVIRQIAAGREGILDEILYKLETGMRNGFQAILEQKAIAMSLNYFNSTITTKRALGEHRQTNKLN